MTLQKEVDENRKNIRSDSYTMSIGEAVNMYHDKEIVIRPEYQRLFRWTIGQQSRLIESILLAIPLPPIFVAQQEDSTWEVVDGLQRLSTILRFMGVLRNEATGEIVEAEPLVKTRYLPSLEGALWDGSSGNFTNALRISMKRARLDFRILQKESDDQIKFELFDRLNSGGAPTSAQEVRTAQLLMRAPEFYRWVHRIRNLQQFRDCVPLTDKQESEQYDLELVIRFLALKNSSKDRLKSFPDIDTFLTDRSLELAKDSEFDKAIAGARFVHVFDILAVVGPDAFRKFDDRRDRPVGAFSVSAFEATTLGVDAHLDAWKGVAPETIQGKIRRGAAHLWHDAQFLKNSGAGVRATQRVPVMSEVGARVFKPESL